MSLTYIKGIISRTEMALEESCRVSLAQTIMIMIANSLKEWDIIIA